jgi:hypothetical protein
MTMLAMLFNAAEHCFYVFFGVDNFAHYWELKKVGGKASCSVPKSLDHRLDTRKTLFV